ncbi:ROK family protein [Erythrobacter sp. NFXS35]|uniref:ROK family protein n=1 Tax=Erythrobacter sp. NFXS35 TaxID=2818436 RepID=UPI0032E055F2
MKVSEKAPKLLFGGIETGGTKTVVAVAAEDGTILASTSMSTTAATETCDRINGWFAKMSSDLGPVASLGIGAFGPIGLDSELADFGVIQETPKPGWAGFDLLTALMPICEHREIVSDVTAAAIGESLAGNVRHRELIAYITVGTGIGVGLARDGCPEFPGRCIEIGHARAKRCTGDNSKSVCPFHDDCFEGLASGPAIASRWCGNLSELAAGHPAHVVECAYLVQLAELVTLAYSPDGIRFGGGVSQTPGLIDQVRKAFAQSASQYGRSNQQLSGKDFIESARLGDRAGIVGALHLARNKTRSDLFNIYF